MPTEIALVQGCVGLLIILASLVALRRQNNRFQNRLALFDHRIAAGREDALRAVESLEKTIAGQAEISQRRLDSLLAESPAATRDEDNGNPKRDVLILVSMPAGTLPKDVSAVVRKIQAAVDDIRTTTGDRFPIRLDAPPTISS